MTFDPIRWRDQAERLRRLAFRLQYVLGNLGPITPKPRRNRRRDYGFNEYRVETILRNAGNEAVDCILEAWKAGALRGLNDELLGRYAEDNEESDSYVRTSFRDLVGELFEENDLGPKFRVLDSAAEYDALDRNFWYVESMVFIAQLIDYGRTPPWKSGGDSWASPRSVEDVAQNFKGQQRKLWDLLKENPEGAGGDLITEAMGYSPMDDALDLARKTYTSMNKRLEPFGVKITQFDKRIRVSEV